MLRFMLGLAVATLLTGPAAAGPPPLDADAGPDINTFMQIGFAGNPRITADGKTLFFVSNSSGVSQLYRLDRETGWPYQLTVFSEGVDFYTLSPDGRQLICGVGLGGDENAQLWLLDARTGQAEPLTELPEVRHGTPLWTSDGTRIYYQSNEADEGAAGTDFNIWTMDLTTGDRELFVSMEGWNGPGDMNDDDTRMFITHWDSNANSDMYLVDVASGKTTHLTPHEGEATFFGAQFAADGRHAYLVSNANPEGLARLAVLDLETLDLSFMDPESNWEVLGLGISRERDLLGWTTNEDGYSRLHIMDTETRRPVPAPPMDGQIGSFGFAENRSGLVFGYSSATSTSDIWYWDWNRPELIKLTHSTYAGVDPNLFQAPELVRFTSFDGLEIPAFLYLPPDYRPGSPVPFVVHMHGGPESQFRPGFIRHFQYLLLNGYGILAPNVRGSSGYGEEYMALDNYTKRLDSVKDMKAGADFLVREGYSAPGLLAVKGGSYGGYMTLAGITEYPELFSAAVDQVGIANFRTFLENTADYRRALREAEYGPLTDPEFLESVSPLNKVDAIRTPLLVIHGANDPRVPVGEAQQIADAIEANGGEVELLIFDDEGHGVSKRPNVLTVYRRMVEFLDTYLKPKERAMKGTE